ncbi:MAG: hypothetical protein KC464_20095, partial [Myxococcales bacterium]|nr:hypothetical protein [Myxococcales bacterium]
MEPTVRTGEVVRVSAIAGRDVRPGDVVAFETARGAVGLH